MTELLDCQYIIYELANEKYAIKIEDVYEIIKMQKITPVYNSKPFLEGVINLRGKITPVISLHKRFNFPDYIPTKLSRTIVLKNREEMIGIIVDKVDQVVKFSDIQTPPEMISSIDEDYLEGIGIHETGVVSILKIDRILYE